MKLHFSPTSPYVRKVMLVLHETGLLDRVEIAPVATTPLAENPGLTASNPLGRIPCLERPDGPALFDSRVICRYLDALAGGGLYPGGAALWSSLTLEALGDGLIDSAVSATYEQRLRPVEGQWRPWIDAQRGKVQRGLDVLEGEWTAHLAGPLDIGAISVAAALGYVDLRFGDLDWRQGRPRLTAWHAGFAARPGYAATNPPA